MFHLIEKDSSLNYNFKLLSEEIIQKELTNNPYGKYLVFEKDNEIVAYIYYSDIYDRIEINQFEVSVSDRNCGIGSQLLCELTENIAKDITLEVSCTNETAIKLYKKYGFKEKAIRKGYYKGVDGILMERVAG